MSLAHNLQENKCHSNTIESFDKNYNKYITIYAQSDKIEINYSNKKIQLSGNVNIKQGNNIIKSDDLMISYNQNNHSLYASILYANGHVQYQNDYIFLKGTTAQFNLNNKNFDFFHGTYYLNTYNIHGAAKTIMQRANHRYTIINQGQITTCNNNSWNITGSKIIYDHYNNNIDIWDACLKIKRMPIFYNPYLSYSLNNKNTLKFYIPNIKYNNTNGLMLKIPFPLFFSKYSSGTISPCYISNSGIGFHTQIHYLLHSSIGIITINTIQKNKDNINNNYYYKFYKLYWKNNSCIHKKWHCNINYVSNENRYHLINIKQNNKTFKNNYINQKFLCYYNNDNIKISAAYLGNDNNYYKNEKQRNCTYSSAPQLELYLYSYLHRQNKLINFQIFNQFSKFIPSHPSFPITIRMHIEPIINFTTYNRLFNFNAETKLKITHYQQNNINNYNKQRHTEYYLKKNINRIIPQFKIQGKMILQKKTNYNSQYKHFLEPTLQYLYTPYSFQENIGIYDTKMIYTNHSNLFHGTIYSGLDRIATNNHIISSIVARCVNNETELFYISIGQIFNLSNKNFKNNNNIKSYLHKNVTNFTLFSGIGHWNINDHWNIHTEIGYHIPINKLFFNNAILEFNNKNNQIFQINYRYINSKYFQQNLIHHYNNIIDYKTISQLGIINFFSLRKNWALNYSQYYNIKFNYLINQSMGIQHITPCWTFGVLCERKIINRNNLYTLNIYEKKIQFYFNIRSSAFNFHWNPYKILKFSMIPYQHAL